MNLPLGISIQNSPFLPFLTVLKSPGATLFAKKDRCLWPEVLYSDFLKSLFFFERHALRNATLLILVKDHLAFTSQTSLTLRMGEVLHIQISSWWCQEYSRFSKSKASAELPVIPWVRQQEDLGLKLWLLFFELYYPPPTPSGAPSFMVE